MFTLGHECDYYLAEVEAKVLAIGYKDGMPVCSILIRKDDRRYNNVPQRFLKVKEN
jgi:hypothetical protein